MAAAAALTGSLAGAPVQISVAGSCSLSAKALHGALCPGYAMDSVAISNK